MVVVTDVVDDRVLVQTLSAASVLRRSADLDSLGGEPGAAKGFERTDGRTEGRKCDEDEDDG